MDRRSFLAGSVVLFAAPLAVEAQQAARVWRIGILGLASNPVYEKVFVDALRERGYVNGQNAVLEWRWAAGRPERLANFADELVQLQADVIVTVSNVAAQAAKDATRTIPIVMAASGDPERRGLVASLSKPGGNVTGLTLDPGAEIFGKLLQLLKEVVPRASRVAAIFSADPTNTRLNLWHRESETVARALGVTIQPFLVPDVPSFPKALAELAQARVDGLVVDSSNLAISQHRAIVQAANARRLPSVYPYRLYADQGGLIAYGVDLSDLFRRAADYVDRVLKGAKPADLPVEQPTKFELAINMKTAKALGLTIPPALLLRADHVIE